MSATTSASGVRSLAWLEHVTGPLGADEERELWDIGGTQHGIFAKRYHLAFARYAAAARACSDAETAERLERAVDAKYLRREGGLLWLDVNREWRIGATAMRIISLAESRGSRFRENRGR